MKRGVKIKINLDVFHLKHCMRRKIDNRFNIIMIKVGFDNLIFVLQVMLMKRRNLRWKMWDNNVLIVQKQGGKKGKLFFRASKNNKRSYSNILVERAFYFHFSINKSIMMENK